MTEELIEYINQVPDKEETRFTIDGDSYKINLGYKLFVYFYHPDYTIEEIVGTYLGHNPYFYSFKEWKEVNDKLYGLWEDCIITSNFSEEHSDHDTAVRLLLDDLISEEELIDFLNQGYRLEHPELKD